MHTTTGDPWIYDTTTAPDLTSPYTPQPVVTDTVTWPEVTEPPIPGTEEFHDFMCWLAGFTDPDTPPSQERWEAFQEKVKDMAALFWEYKKEQRAREFNQQYQVSIGMDYAASSAEVPLGNITKTNISTM